MTPEERARAEAINEEISRQQKARRSGIQSLPVSAPESTTARIPGISRTPPDYKPWRPSATLLICLAITLNVAGFIGYDLYKDHKEREVAKEAVRRLEEQAESMMREANRQGALAAQQMSSAFQAPSYPSAKYVNTASADQQRTTPQQHPAPQQRQAPSPRVIPPKPAPQQRVKSTLSPEEAAEKHAIAYFTNYTRHGPLRVKPNSISIRRTITTTVIENRRYKTTGQAHIAYTGSTGGEVSEVRYFETVSETGNADPIIISFRETTKN